MAGASGFRMIPQELISRERLRSGRHGLTRDEVLTSQRGRLLDAMVECVAARGYGAVTVADVVERAGVSRRTFYELFCDKESCFLAAYDLGVEVMLSRIHAAVAEAVAAPGRRRPPRPLWMAQARAAVETFLATLAEEPAFALALEVEVLAAGPAALDRRRVVLGVFGSLWRTLHAQAREEDPTLPELPDAVFGVLTAGLEEVVRDGIRGSGSAALAGLAPGILAVVTAVFGGRAYAGRA